MSAVPEFFGAGEEMMCGWFHPAAAAADRGTVVVLCPALGFDLICSYRSWRILAERLAAAGFGVLRFDYLATGNSAGNPEEPHQVARWLRSIELAVEHARARTGAERVVLVGLRLGATLAACAARTIPGVDSLVLWSPFRSGRLYARELIALARLSRPESSEEIDASSDLEAAGFLVTRATLDELSGLDMLALSEQPAPRVLVIEREDFPSDSRLLEHLTHLGCAVTVDRIPGTLDTLVQPIRSKVPEPILDRIVTWLVDGHPEHRIAGAVTSPARSGAGHGPGWREQPMNFGPDRRLFGILTRPESNEPPAAAVVFLNTGCEHHVGPHRMYVPLSRAWAREGYASLRFDLGGIGDSRTPAGVIENEAYPPHAMDDVASAVAEVRRTTGAESVVVFGICSGGWHAFRAVRDGLPVDAVMAINAPLYVREGSEYTITELEERLELERYSRSATDPEKWKKVLRGGASIATFTRLAVGAVLRWVRAKVKWLGSKLGTASGRDNLGGDLRTIAARKVPTKFVFSDDDLGLAYFHLHARGPLRLGRGLMSWTVVSNAEHTFGPLQAQCTLRELMRDFLQHTGVKRSD